MKLFKISLMLIFFMISINSSKSEEVLLKNTKNSTARALEEKRIELELKERILQEREKNLGDQEERLSKAVEEFKKTQIEFSQKQEKIKIEEQTYLSKVITAYEAMSPQSLGSVLENLPEKFAAIVARKLDSKKLAKAMGFMKKEKSAQLSAQMAGYSEEGSRSPASSTPGEESLLKDK